MSDPVNSDQDATTNNKKNTSYFSLISYSFAVKPFHKMSKSDFMVLSAIIAVGFGTCFYFHKKYR